MKYSRALSSLNVSSVGNWLTTGLERRGGGGGGGGEGKEEGEGEGEEGEEEVRVGNA